MSGRPLNKIVVLKRLGRCNSSALALANGAISGRGHCCSRPLLDLERWWLALGVKRLTLVARACSSRRPKRTCCIWHLIDYVLGRLARRQQERESCCSETLLVPASCEVADNTTKRRALVICCLLLPQTSCRLGFGLCLTISEQADHDTQVLTCGSATLGSFRC